MSKTTQLTSAKAIYEQLELLAERKRKIMRAENELKRQLVKLARPVPVRKGKILFKNSRATIMEVLRKKFAKREYFNAYDLFTEIRKRYPVKDGSNEYRLLRSNVYKSITELSRSGDIEVIADTSPRSYRVPQLL